METACKTIVSQSWLRWQRGASRRRAFAPYTRFSVDLPPRGARHLRPGPVRDYDGITVRARHSPADRAAHRIFRNEARQRHFLADQAGAVLRADRLDGRDRQRILLDTAGAGDLRRHVSGFTWNGNRDGCLVRL